MTPGLPLPRQVWQQLVTLAPGPQLPPERYKEHQRHLNLKIIGSY